MSGENWIRPALFLFAAGIHGALIFSIAFTGKTAPAPDYAEKTIQLVDIRELVEIREPPPPVPRVQPQNPPAPSPAVETPVEIAETLIEIAETLPAAVHENDAPDTSISSTKESGAGKAETALTTAYIQKNFAYIQRRIRDKLIYPPHARRMGIQGLTEVIFTIHQDGTVSGVSVKTGSGQELLDKAAVDAIYAAAPFRPPPPVQVRLVIPVAFKLR